MDTQALFDDFVRQILMGRGSFRGSASEKSFTTEMRPTGFAMIDFVAMGTFTAEAIREGGHSGYDTTESLVVTVIFEIHCGLTLSSRPRKTREVPGTTEVLRFSTVDEQGNVITAECERQVLDRWDLILALGYWMGTRLGDELLEALHIVLRFHPSDALAAQQKALQAELDKAMFDYLAQVLPTPPSGPAEP